MIELIPAILLRFRLRKIGVTSDIKKAFLQIEVREADRDFLRFLWWEEGDPRRLKEYRHSRVVFGVTASPFLLAATLAHHLNKAPEHLQRTATMLKTSMYVDNCIASLDGITQLESFRREADLLMASAQMELRGWRCTESNNKTKTENWGKETATSRVLLLGLIWDCAEDTLSCNLSPPPNDKILERITKRTVLSVAHQLFDPIGFTSPLTLHPKLQLQRAWEMKLTWDEEFPEDEKSKFCFWMKELPLLHQVKIPRWIMNDVFRSEKVSLHVFCDASKLAYATCIFLRNDSSNGINVQLVQAKTRVAPLKQITIARLELLACIIGVRLAETVKRELPDPDIRVYYWTDSSNALGWITSGDQWSAFVWNRVKEIRATTEPKNWNHVPGIDNPADLPSRGCSARQLLESRWWEGPEWLKKPPTEWPQSELRPDAETLNSEKRKTVISAISLVSSGEWFEKFSSFWKIVRIMGWIKRFANNARKSNVKLKGELSLEETEKAEIDVLRIVQTEAFLGRADERLRSTELIQDSSGLLRVKTRLLMRDDTMGFKYPMVLPNDHRVVLLLIQWWHQHLEHCGVQTLVSRLRENYWILKGRRVIRKVVRECGRCRRFTAKARNCPPAPLPMDRVSDSATFATTGVDLAGPLFVKGGTKAWVVLFTCAVYRAVHLELVTSLSTDTFLRALRRFVARRGRPKVIYSDNGTNFVGADRELGKIDWETVASRGVLQRISWKFNPPTAAWWGGWWERLVGLMKQLLRRVLGRAVLSLEELGTVLCDCEAVLNSRPLTYLSEESNDLVPLTPDMFLRDPTATGLPELDSLDHRSLNRRQRHCQIVRNSLRQRFRIEYLAQLRQRWNATPNMTPVSVGDVVLVGSDNSKRQNWRLARVIQTFPGRDGHIRVCRVKTAAGELLRPVQRLYPLEVSRNESTQKESDPESRDTESAKNQQSRPGYITRSGRQVRSPKRLTM